MAHLSLEQAARALGGDLSAGGQILAPGPDHSAGDRSLSIKIDPAAPDGFLVESFAGDDWKTCRDYVRQKLSMEPFQPKKRGSARIVATYDYVDENGVPISQAVRYEPKAFKQRRPDGNGGWTWKTRGARKVVYRLPQVGAAIAAGQSVFIVEGEKDADNLAQLGLVATCNAGGASEPGKASKWKVEHSQCLTGADVIILPDNDAPGRAHADAVASSLTGFAARVRVLELPGLPDKGDVSDWLAAGGDDETLAALVDSQARDWQPREDAPQPAAPAGPAFDGSRINGARLLDAVQAFIRRFLVYPDVHAYVAVTLWIAHCYRMDVWDNTPRLLFTSYQPGSGKSRSLEIVELLTPRAISAFNCSAAYLIRKVAASERALPVILYDEIDALFGTGKASEKTEEVRAVINAGHRRGAKIGRCKLGEDGVETEELAAYAPIAMAGLDRHLPDTITSRSVVINVKRRSPREQVEPLRVRFIKADADQLASGLKAWTEHAVTGSYPDMPPDVTDRDADVWEPLISVADAAGGDWPERARKAALFFVDQRSNGRQSLGVKLLSDIKSVFKKNESEVSTAVLITRLIDIEESPWGDMKGKPLSERMLASMLKPFDIRSERFGTDPNRYRGYATANFNDAFERYLSGLPVQSGQASQNWENA